MGSLGDGSGWPPDGGVPDLPPEWGDIVIPDDISSLADETAAVRAELRLDRRRTTGRRLLDQPAVRGLSRVLSAGLRLPVLIITIAVLVTVASLFASAWPGPARPPATQRTAGSTDSRDSLPALELVAADGQAVPLLGRLPAVILLVDGCDCAALVQDTNAAVRAPVTVVTVTTGLPALSAPPVAPGQPPGPASVGPAPVGPAPVGPGSPGPAPVGPAPVGPAPVGGTVRQLYDPTGELRAAFRLPEPDETAAALLVDGTGRVVRTVPRTFSVTDFQADLARLS